VSRGAPGPAYDEAYYRETFGRDMIRAGSVAWWSIRFYAKLAERLLRARGGRRALDLGCAHGHLLARLAGKFETWGVDVSEYAVQRSRELAPRSRIVLGDLARGIPPTLGETAFDVIVARYVLEHLEDPAALLREMAGRLSTSGAALISVPNTASPGRRFKGEAWFGFRDPTHVSLWPPERWIEETRLAGLRVDRIFSDGLWDVPYVKGVPAALQYALFSVPAAAQVLAARPMLPLSWGENLILIASLPRQAGAHGRA